MFVIYGLCEPDTFEIRYVGLSGNSSRRLGDHRKSRIGIPNQTRLAHWLRRLQVNRIQCKTVLLEFCATREEVVLAEQKWIALLRYSGLDLLNHTDGGDGNFGYKHTEATKAVIREKRALQKPRSFTDEQRAEHSKILRGIPKSDEAKLHISTATKKAYDEGRLISPSLRPEVRAKISASNKARFADGRQVPPTTDPEILKKAIESRRGYSHSKETRDKISSSQKGKHNRGVHTRWHVNKSVKNATCYFCKEEHVA